MIIRTQQEIEYENECRRIIQQYPKQIKKVFEYEYCELEFDFLGFLNVYQINIPKDFTIIDLGCYLGIQSIYFENHKQYIGIDIATPIEYRFNLHNTKHYKISIEDFIKDLSKYDLNKTFAICSYVPLDDNIYNDIAKKFPYHKIQYCDNIISENYPKEN